MTDPSPAVQPALVNAVKPLGVTPLACFQPLNWVEVALVVGVHGIKGWLKLKTADPYPDWLEADLKLSVSPGSLALQQKHPKGLHWQIVTAQLHKPSVVLLQINTLTERTQAENWIGSRLYLPKASLPEVTDSDTYRTCDLMGLAVFSADVPERQWGSVSAIVAQPGSEDCFLELTLPVTGKTALVPFKAVFVPRVDLPGQRLWIAGLDAFLEEEDTPLPPKAPAKRPPRNKRKKPPVN